MYGIYTYGTHDNRVHFVALVRSNCQPFGAGFRLKRDFTTLKVSVVKFFQYVLDM